MREILVVVILCLSGRALATAAYGYSETIVGWSEDGDTYAIVRGEGPLGPAELQVRQGVTNKQVAAFADGDKGVPSANDKGPGVERIDVTTWEPLKKYKLKTIESAARSRFKDGYELATIGKRADRYHCPGGGWTLKKKGDSKPIVEIKPKGDHCFALLGGYVHANTKRALIKLTELSWTVDKNGESSSDDDTQFVLVELK